MNGTTADLAYLFSPQAIRDRSLSLYEAAMAGKTAFIVHPEMLPKVARYVSDVTLATYPKLEIPLHSRWGHFQASGIDRLQDLNDRLKALSPEDRARSKIDLVIVSVLLDAGSGPAWKYQETSTGKIVDRSEGLAVASLRMFLAGEFSSDHSQPLRADGEKLAAFSMGALERGFQISRKNVLAGMEGRLKLLRELGRAVLNDRERFPGARPGGLFDFFGRGAVSGSIAATRMLLAVLEGLGPIWPGRLKLGSTPLGDVWSHPLLGEPDSVHSLVPFHKLSQWLTYSLVEPLLEAGMTVDGIEKLTGLAEYRNGGLLLDRGLIELRDPADSKRIHHAGSNLVVEWRALTIVLLDRITEEVRHILKMTEAELPLAKVLEGGTWRAGRMSASELREGGGPPLQIQSDGTVF